MLGKGWGNRGKTKGEPQENQRNTGGNLSKNWENGREGNQIRRATAKSEAKKTKPKEVKEPTPAHKNQHQNETEQMRART